MRRKRLIEECEAELRRLREENRHLRQASSGFADLAERLMRSLRRERHRLDEAERMRLGRSVAHHPQVPEELAAPQDED